MRVAFSRPRLAGALLLVLPWLALAAAPGQARVVFAAWLGAWWCCAGWAVGSRLVGAIHRLTGGRWGEVLQPALRAVGGRLPLALALLLPLAIGAGRLYDWAADPSGGWARHLAQPHFLVAWMQPWAVGLRVLTFAAAAAWCARAGTFARKGGAASCLVLLGLAGSLLAVDLLMSLVTGWRSSAFGLVALAGWALGGSALLVALHAAAPSPAGTQGEPEAPRHGPGAMPRTPPVFRDHGNLLLMWTMVWAYLSFMEFLIIWAENLPNEISWYLPRLQTGWAAGGLALVVAQWALPMLALLFRPVKDDPRRLGRLAAWLLAAQVLGGGWLVLPSVDPQAAAALPLLACFALGMALCLYGDLPARLRAEVAGETRR